MKILGISCFYHDSAAAIIEDGIIIAAAQEERFTRIKQDPSFPHKSIEFCLKYGGTTIDELDAVVFYDKPLLKFERLLETYYNFAPKGIASFVTAIPIWLKEKLFLKKLIRDELGEVEKYNKKELNLLFTEHHQSHAASAYYPSGFEDSVILTVDGVGEWATASIGIGEGNQLRILKEIHFPHSIGLLYSSFTYWLGFKVNSGEYKLMGLAPYGNPKSTEVEKFIEIIRTKLIDLKEDGSIWLDQEYFTYATGLRMVNESKWRKLFGFARREIDSEIEQKHCDLALAIQRVTEEAILKMATYAKTLTGKTNLCLAGGVALNCVANGKLAKSKIFDEIFIQPASGDAGGALGAALAVYHQYFDQELLLNSSQDHMQGSLLGPHFSDIEIELVVKKKKANFKKLQNIELLTDRVSDLILEGKVVGWFQGRMEYGPRALGNRSILGDPRNPEMQKRINLKIKYRENFRPFAPSVMREDVAEYFDFDEPSPYMLMVSEIKDKCMNDIPQDYNDYGMKDRLAFVKSEFPSVTHVDFTARIQTVDKETNPRYWALLYQLKKKTGVGMVLNTSFNVRGEPIVCSPEDAYHCFMNTEMDYLVIGDYIFDKLDQTKS